jgi:hypothetical protein
VLTGDETREVPEYLKQGVLLVSDKRPGPGQHQIRKFPIKDSKFCSRCWEPESPPHHRSTQTWIHHHSRNCLYLDVGARISSTPQKKPVMDDMVEFTLPTRRTDITIE